MGDQLTYDHRMSASDALMWNIEKDPMLRSTITAVAVLDRAPDRQRLLDRVERGTRLIPRMRQRVVSSPYSIAPPRWAVDRHFDLGYHVRFVTCPAPGSPRELLDLAEPIAMDGFDRARPLWEFVVVDGLQDGRAAIIQKLHHSITDGVGGIQIAMSLVDLERDPGEVADHAPPAPPPDDWSFARRVLDAGRYESTRQLVRLRRAMGVVPRAAADVGAAAREATATARSIARMLAPVTSPLSPLMRDRSLSVRFDQLTVPLQELKDAGRAADGKLNDAFVAAVLGGLHRYHGARGSDVEELRVNMPINIRDSATQRLAGNQFVPARFALPAAIADPLERMREVRRIVAEQRAEPALRFTGALADVLNRLPTSLVTEVFGQMLKGIDFTASNVPGVPIPIYIGGAMLESLTPFGPLAGSATNITLVSHLDDVHVGVAMDPAAIDDTGLFVDCLRAGFEEILKAG